VNGLGVGGIGRSAVFDPAGRLLYQGDSVDQIIPIEIDLDQVRRSRQNGIRGLGQVLKSFRDRRTDFPVYDSEKFDPGYLESLGPLVQPRRPDAPQGNVAPLPLRRSWIK
jgi:deaminated glutathione amidase